MQGGRLDHAVAGLDILAKLAYILLYTGIELVAMINSCFF